MGLGTSCMPLAFDQSKRTHLEIYVISHKQYIHSSKAFHLYYNPCLSLCCRKSLMSFELRYDIHATLTYHKQYIHSSKAFHLYYNPCLSLCCRKSLMSFELRYDIHATLTYLTNNTLICVSSSTSDRKSTMAEEEFESKIREYVDQLWIYW